jgi:hypothetical protein
MPFMWRFVEAGAVLLAAVACNSPQPQLLPPPLLDFPPPDSDAGSSGDGASADVASTLDAALDVANDVWSAPVTARDAEPGVGLDATDLDAPGPDPPALACDADANGGICVLPPSRCANGLWLVYYDNGQCVGGWCTWDKRYVNCGGACYSGSCQPLLTR